MRDRNQDAKASLRLMRSQLDAIDAELAKLVDQLVAGTIHPTLARVREISLTTRRSTIQRQFDAVLGSIKHF